MLFFPSVGDIADEYFFAVYVERKFCGIVISRDESFLCNENVLELH